MSSDKISKTVGVALGVCLVCSVLVSTAAVELKSIQDNNKKLDLLTNILIAADLNEEGQDPQEIFENKINSEIVDLEAGDFLSKDAYTDELNVENFDIDSYAGSAELGKSIPAENDKAGIKKMPKYMAVYEVKDQNGIEKYVLPIYGKGLWSTMYGFIALDKDLKTVKGFTFYQHGETPGLGGEVDNPKWKALWNGKQIFDESGKLNISVIKGVVDPNDAQATHKVDGLSGATLTTRGVNNLINFWLGENGYGPFLKKLRGGEV